MRTSIDIAYAKKLLSADIYHLPVFPKPPPGVDAP
jgi:hypothetical protein